MTETVKPGRALHEPCSVSENRSRRPRSRAPVDSLLPSVGNVRRCPKLADDSGNGRGTIGILKQPVEHRVSAPACVNCRRCRDFHAPTRRGIGRGDAGCVRRGFFTVATGVESDARREQAVTSSGCTAPWKAPSWLARFGRGSVRPRATS